MNYSDFMRASESDLERSFWHFAAGIRDRFKRVEPQYKVAGYRIDGAFHLASGKIIGVELDGAAYHDREKDYSRDMIILETGLVQEIIRIPYAAMTFYRHATFAVLGMWHNQFDISPPSCCFSWREFLAEWKIVENDIAETGPGTFSSVYEWLEFADVNYEVFDCCETSGFATSPKTAIRRFDDNSKLRPITRWLPMVRLGANFEAKVATP